ncbi:unnamed protein product [Miscanthus lutarioriparius]|uniref:Uncharacterized protein n=1 Tax=Miscanthus lutarioriparius TaxID=422564 RepID=A0A811SMB2_9POAL|nr:unnamed protein product [Miscanthus lutarioriparius]
MATGAARSRERPRHVSRRGPRHGPKLQEQVLTPPQSLTSGPRRSPGGGGAFQSPFEVSDSLSSPSPILSSHSPVSSGEGGNPSDSLRIATEGRTGSRTRLPHENEQPSQVDQKEDSNPNLKVDSTEVETSTNDNTQIITNDNQNTQEGKIQNVRLLERLKTYLSSVQENMEQAKSSGQTFKVGPSNNVNVGKGKQVSADSSQCSQKVNQQQACSDEDSEDEGLKIGDLVAPGSDQLRFGNFDTLVKYKQDPLITIEAKNALHGGDKSEFFQLEDYIGKSRSSKSLPTIMEDKEDCEVVRATSMSPMKGSQGGPEVNLSSQEESQQKGSQDIDWDLIQEDGQGSKLTEMDVDSAKGHNRGEGNLQDTRVEEDSSKADVNQGTKMDKIIEEKYDWDKHVSTLKPMVEAEQEVSKDVRQSKRIKDVGTSQLKMGGQA